MIEKDVTLRDEGNVILICFNTEAAVDWAADFISEEAIWFDDKVAIDPIHFEHLLLSLKKSNLDIELTRD